jgi:hypothetical protein
VGAALVFAKTRTDRLTEGMRNTKKLTGAFLPRS